MFKKILIANRGEIALRVIRSCKEMGIKTVAVYSTADKDSLHVRFADEAVCIGPPPSKDSYLNIPSIIAAAEITNADGIHPGYGFLSENAAFAQSCREAGIAFIGPSPEAIRAMGDKIIAKQTAMSAGVPVVPGWSGTGGEDAPAAMEAARRIGYPVLIKAAAGGGGKGMRVVSGERDLASAMESARREAGSAFGDNRVFIEKYIEKPRHVEIQIFGDGRGNVVHLFERECSIQRRHQKLVEESPSPAVNAELRAAMGEAAVRLAKTIGYPNAGTVEFILDPTDNFYFLEVNTRLQVEHPVTELVTQLDLVSLQVRVAAGEALPFGQADLRQTGHAMECRICAEDASRAFVPSIGELAVYRPPTGRNIRVDSGVTQGSKVSVYYDPMLAKLIVWGGTREESIARMVWALERFVVLGVTTNVEFLRRVLLHPEFAAGNLHTHFLDEHRIATAEEPMPTEALLVAALATQAMANGRPASGHGWVTKTSSPDPWRTAGAWRMS